MARSFNSSSANRDIQQGNGLPVKSVLFRVPLEDKGINMSKIEKFL